MRDEKDEIVDIDDDEVDLSNQRKIYTDIGDPEVKGLHDKYKRGKLNIQPDFQRHFVWDAQKSSNLIESAMLGIPLPVVYFSEDGKGKNSVIDGQQRLTAFFSFIDGHFPDGKEFSLSKLKIFKDFNKKKFSDLPEEYQDKILECKVRTIVFKKDSDKDLKFEIFERLNSGSVTLNDQELRNCLYRGRYNDLLRELSADATYMKIMGYKEPHKRMVDVQYVLRFFAFYNQGYMKYSSPMKKFMNQEMEERQNISVSDADRLKKIFKNSVNLVNSLLGEGAFRKFTMGDAENPAGMWDSSTKSFNASLFDILMWSFADQDKNAVMRNLDWIKEELIGLMTSNPDFVDSILRATSNTKAVRQRFDIWRKTLDRIFAGQDNQPRLFSRELKQRFYDANPTCEICENRINDIDDAVLDHEDQYWQGGKTVPENARLAHRYCNNTRPRKER